MQRGEGKAGTTGIFLNRGKISHNDLSRVFLLLIDNNMLLWKMQEREDVSEHAFFEQLAEAFNNPRRRVQGLLFATPLMNMGWMKNVNPDASKPRSIEKVKVIFERVIAIYPEAYGEYLRHQGSNFKTFASWVDRRKGQQHWLKLMDYFVTTYKLEHVFRPYHLLQILCYQQQQEQREEEQKQALEVDRPVLRSQTKASIGSEAKMKTKKQKRTRSLSRDSLGEGSHSPFSSPSSIRSPKGRKGSDSSSSSSSSSIELPPSLQQQQPLYNVFTHPHYYQQPADYGQDAYAMYYSSPAVQQMQMQQAMLYQQQHQHLQLQEQLQYQQRQHQHLQHLQHLQQQEQLQMQLQMQLQQLQRQRESGQGGGSDFSMLNQLSEIASVHFSDPRALHHEEHSERRGHLISSAVSSAVSSPSCSPPPSPSASNQQSVSLQPETEPEPESESGPESGPGPGPGSDQEAFFPRKRQRLGML